MEKGADSTLDSGSEVVGDLGDGVSSVTDKMTGVFSSEENNEKEEE